MFSTEIIVSGYLLFNYFSLVSHFHIITAAHCAKIQPDASQILAHVGFTLRSEGKAFLALQRHSSGPLFHLVFISIPAVNTSRYSASYGIQRIIIHEGYKDDPPVNDISVLVTKVLIEWERGVGPICLPPAA